MGGLPCQHSPESMISCLMLGVLRLATVVGGVFEQKLTFMHMPHQEDFAYET
jgi:hypothetical protein